MPALDAGMRANVCTVAKARLTDREFDKVKADLGQVLYFIQTLPIETPGKNEASTALINIRQKLRIYG